MPFVYKPSQRGLYCFDYPDNPSADSIYSLDCMLCVVFVCIAKKVSLIESSLDVPGII